jgi:hypothetical protein
MRRAAIVAVAFAGAALLAACTEQPQTNMQGVKHDAPPWTGTSNGTAAAQPGGGTAFTAPGWQVGDKASWEQHMKTRAQNGQNEYTRTN